jgi:hypothetical protein
MKLYRAGWLALAGVLLVGGPAVGQEPMVGEVMPSHAATQQPLSQQVEATQYTYSAAPLPTSSTAYPDGQFAAQLAAARGEGPCACDWGWGCGGSPFRTGPGNCDDWRVGPRWHTKLDGVFIGREDINLDALGAGAVAGGVTIDPTGANTVSDNFGHGAGVRLSISSYWPQCKGYEMQISYLGIFGMEANAYDPDVPFVGPLPEPPGFETQKSLSYRSSLNSIEFNAQRVTDHALKFYGGVRYVLLGEDVSDSLTQSNQPPIIPPNVVGGIVGDPPQDITDILRNMSVDNNLVGFQAGMRTDLFSVGNRFYVEYLIGAGAYCNFITRKSGYSETRTVLALDDPSTAGFENISDTTNTRSGYKADRTRAALVGEALLGGVYEVNACTRARLGYQVLYLNGVELGNEAFLGAGPTSSDLLLHGWFAGVEYKR